jgi:hypothetical protein
MQARDSAQRDVFFFERALGVCTDTPTRCSMMKEVAPMFEDLSNVWGSTASTLESPEHELVVSAERAMPALASPGLSVQDPPVIDTEVDELVRAFFSGKSDRTIESYRRCLRTDL